MIMDIRIMYSNAAQVEDALTTVIARTVLLVSFMNPSCVLFGMSLFFIYLELDYLFSGRSNAYGKTIYRIKPAAIAMEFRLLIAGEVDTCRWNFYGRSRRTYGII